MRFLLSIIGIALGVLFPKVAFLQSLPPPPCTYPGCGGAPANLIVDSAIPTIGIILLNTAVALSVLFTIIGGARYLISFGRDEEYNKGKQTIIWALGGLVVAVTSHRLVTVVISQQYTGTSGNPILDIISIIVSIITVLLNAVFLIVILLSGFRLVMARGKDEEVTKGRHGLLYAIAGAVIINVAPFVVKAILNI